MCWILESAMIHNIYREGEWSYNSRKQFHDIFFEDFHYSRTFQVVIQKAKSEHGLLLDLSTLELPT
jgi:hypothetical protein